METSRIPASETKNTQNSAVPRKLRTGPDQGPAPVRQLNLLRNVPAALSLTAGALPAHVRHLVNEPGPGEPLMYQIQHPLQESLAVDLQPVRVHTDSRAAGIVASIGARAFTYGKHIFLGSQERASDLALMAHEIVHVVQQQGAVPVIQKFTGGSTTNSYEHEAQQSAEAIQHGEPVQVQNYTGGSTVQKAEKPSLLQRGLNLGSEVVQSVVEWGEDKIWSLLDEFAPELVPILRQGVFEWLKEKITNAVQSVFDTLFAPVRAVTGVIASLSAHFNDLLAWMREAAAKIAKGDCSSISEAADKIQKVVEGLASPVIDKIKNLAGKVGEFFSGLWERFGAPAWDFLKKVGGQVWTKIQQFATSIWDKTKPIRDLAASAWKWFKNKLGVGEGPEGQNGLLQWAQEKASAAWDWVKAKIEPIKKPLMVVAGVMVMLSPAGPLIAIGAAAFGLMKGIQWIRQHLNTPDGVVKERGVLKGVIIPAIMGAVNGVTSALTKAANFVKEKLNKIVGGLGEAAGAIGGSVISFVAGIVSWLAEQFKGLADWATDKVSGLVEWVSSGLDRLRIYLQPILDVLGQIATVVGNILQIPMLVLGRLWKIIPACIRNPFVDFLINQILKRIPLVSNLVELVEIWPQIKAEAMSIIRQIFVQGDLSGAMLRILKLLLKALKVPLQLVTNIFTKAASALDLIMANPGNFLKNVLRALKQGFVQFFGAIGTHLLNGLKDWLFGQVQQGGITPPTDLSLRSIFGLVLDVFGITTNHVLERLERKIGKEKVDKIRRVLSILTGVWEWVKIAIEEGPKGLWRKMTEKLSNLWNLVLDAIIGWMTERIITRVTAKILSMLDPTGVMAAVNSIIAIYNAIESAIEYLRQILEIVDKVMDVLVGIATGAIGPAANALEMGLARAIPVAIGFLANQVSLSGLGKRIKEIIQKIRAKVDEGIDWLIDKAIGGIDALMKMIGMGKDKPGEPSAGGDVAIEKNFTMKGQSHKLTAKTHDKKLKIIIASTPKEIMDAIAVAINALKTSATPPPDKNELIKELEDLRKQVNPDSAGKAFWEGDRRFKGVRYDREEQFVSAVADFATLRLFQIAAAHNLTDLENFFSGVPEKRYLPSNYDVRASLYIRGSGWKDVQEQVMRTGKNEVRNKVIAAKAKNDEGTFAALISQGKLPRDFNKTDFVLSRVRNVAIYNLQNFNPDWIVDGTIKYHVDHKSSLAEHWQKDSGNNTGDDIRWKEATRLNNLEMLVARANLSKGSIVESEPDLRAQFAKAFWVGLGFTSKFANNNVPKAKNIDGQPFLSSENGPPLV